MIVVAMIAALALIARKNEMECDRRREKDENELGRVKQHQGTAGGAARLMAPVRTDQAATGPAAACPGHIRASTSRERAPAEVALRGFLHDMLPECGRFSRFRLDDQEPPFLMRLLCGFIRRIVARQDYPLEFRPFAFALFPDDPALLSSTAPELTSGRCLFGLGRRLMVSCNGRNGMGKSSRYFRRRAHRPARYRRIVSATPDARFLWARPRPRDVLLSARAFDRSGLSRVREQDGDSDEIVVLKYADGFRQLIDGAERPDARLVRYEQLIGSNGHAALARCLFVARTGRWRDDRPRTRSVQRCTPKTDTTQDVEFAAAISCVAGDREMSGHLVDLYATLGT